MGKCYRLCFSLKIYIFTHVTDFYVDVFDKSLSDSHSPICITISCNPTSYDETVKPSDTVIQHPKYKSKWKPECTDIYTQSFDVNEITTISDEITLHYMGLHYLQPPPPL